MSSKTILIKKSPEELNTKQLIIKLFSLAPQAKYSSQKEISLAIKKNFAEERNQSAISKALKDLKNKEINLKNQRYKIAVIGRECFLYTPNKIPDELVHDFFTKEVFSSFDIFCIYNTVVAFDIEKSRHAYVEKHIVNALGENNFFDVISYNDKLYFLLKKGNKVYDRLVNLPKKVEDSYNIYEHN